MKTKPVIVILGILLVAAGALLLLFWPRSAPERTEAGNSQSSNTADEPGGAPPQADAPDKSGIPQEVAPNSGRAGPAWLTQLPPNVRIVGDPRLSLSARNELLERWMRHGNPEVSKQLLDVVTCPHVDETIRNNICNSLHHRLPEALTNALIRTLTDTEHSKKWRTYALQHLGMRVETEGNPDALRAVLDTAQDHAEAPLQRQALFTLALICRNTPCEQIDQAKLKKKLLALLNSALEAEAPTTRANAVRATAVAECGSLLPKIRNIMKDGQAAREERRAAIAAVLEMRDAQSVPLLEKIAESASDSLLKSTATDALAKLRSTEIRN